MYIVICKHAYSGICGFGFDTDEEMKADMSLRKRIKDYSDFNTYQYDIEDGKSMQVGDYIFKNVVKSKSHGIEVSRTDGKSMHRHKSFFFDNLSLEGYSILSNIPLDEKSVIDEDAKQSRFEMNLLALINNLLDAMDYSEKQKEEDKKLELYRKIRMDYYATHKL